MRECPLANKVLSSPRLTSSSTSRATTSLSRLEVSRNALGQGRDRGNPHDSWPEPLLDQARTKNTYGVFPTPLPSLLGRKQPVSQAVAWGAWCGHGETNEEIASDFGGGLAPGDCSFRSDDGYGHNRRGRSSRPDRAAVLRPNIAALMNKSLRYIRYFRRRAKMRARVPYPAIKPTTNIPPVRSVSTTSGPTSSIVVVILVMVESAVSSSNSNVAADRRFPALM